MNEDIKKYLKQENKQLKDSIENLLKKYELKIELIGSNWNEDFTFHVVNGGYVSKAYETLEQVKFNSMVSHKLNKKEWNQLCFLIDEILK